MPLIHKTLRNPVPPWSGGGAGLLRAFVTPYYGTLTGPPRRVAGLEAVGEQGSAVVEHLHARFA